MPPKPRTDRNSSSVAALESSVADANTTVVDDGSQTVTVPASEAPQLPQGAAAGELVDAHVAHYEGFDPTVHAVDQDGKPIPKKGGGWQKKRGGNMRHPGAARTDGAVAKVKAAPVDTLNAAKQFLNLVISLACIGFGEHWAPNDEGEKKGLTDAVKNYFDAKGTVEVSPGVALSLAVLAYSLPRLKDERTTSKLNGIRVAVYRGYLWVSGLWRPRA